MSVDGHQFINRRLLARTKIDGSASHASLKKSVGYKDVIDVALISPVLLKTRVFTLTNKLTTLKRNET